MMKEDPFISAPKISAEIARIGIKACPSSIRSECIKAGYNGRIARKKPFIIKVNLKKRLKFENDHKNKDLDFGRRYFSQMRANSIYLGPTSGAWCDGRKTRSWNPRN
jgi:Transposase.